MLLFGISHKGTIKFRKSSPHNYLGLSLVLSNISLQVDIAASQYYLGNNTMLGMKGSARKNREGDILHNSTNLFPLTMLMKKEIT